MECDRRYTGINLEGPPFLKLEKGVPRVNHKHEQKGEHGISKGDSIWLRITHGLLDLKRVSPSNDTKSTIQWNSAPTEEKNTSKRSNLYVFLLSIYIPPL